MCHSATKSATPENTGFVRGTKAPHFKNLLPQRGTFYAITAQIRLNPNRLILLWKNIQVLPLEV